MSAAANVTLEREEQLRIGELAQLAGLTTRTLRYWEQIGLLSPHGHLQGGQRLYSSAEVERVKRIRDLQDLLGLRLSEIRAVLEADDLLDKVRRAFHEGARAERQRRLLEDATIANDRLIARLEDTLERIKAFKAERVAKAERMHSRAELLGAPGESNDTASDPKERS